MGPAFAFDADARHAIQLLDRGSLSAKTVVANVQNFITLVAKGLKLM